MKAATSATTRPTATWNCSPDFSTLCSVPWAADPTAQVIHDAFYHDGRPVEIAPRASSSSAPSSTSMRKRGWEPVVAPELEFYLVKQQTSTRTIRWSRRSAARAAPSRRPLYSIAGVNEFDAVFEDIYAHSPGTGPRGRRTP